MERNQSAVGVELLRGVEILQLITVRSETGLQLSQEAPARLRSRNDALQVKGEFIGRGSH